MADQEGGRCNAVDDLAGRRTREGEMKTTELVTFNRSVVVSPREASRLPQVLDTPTVQLVPVDNIAKVALRPGARRAGSVARKDADANRQADRVGEDGLQVGPDARPRRSRSSFPSPCPRLERTPAPETLHTVALNGKTLHGNFDHHLG